MHKFIHLLQQIFLKSLVPLSLISLFGCLQRQVLFKDQPRINHESHPIPQDDNVFQILITLFSFIKTRILNTYGNFSSFFGLFILMAFANLIGSPVKVSTRYQRILKGVIFCGIFSSFYSLAAASASSPSEFLPYSNQEIRFNSSASHSLSFSMGPMDPRLLEQEETGHKDTLTSPLTSSDIRTLSIGKIVSTLKVNPDSIILSHDNRLAFIILKFSGALKVIDISDNQNPIIIGSLENLAHLRGNFHLKKMVLSADGKTIFTTRIESLEIIDVSDPQNPVLKTSSKDPLFINVTTPPDFCLPTVALSSDGKTLYVGGGGLQIINVTNTSNPEILFSIRISGMYKTMTSIALSPDSKTLLYGDDTLDFYDVSDPSKLRLFHSYSSPNISICSVLLSKNASKVYVTGTLSENPFIMLEEIDISQQESPKPLGSYPLAKAGLYNPSIIAISPNETNLFVMRGALTNMAEIIGFDLLKKQIMTQSTNFFVDTYSFVMIPGTNNIITNSNRQFQITKLFQDYPNTKTFCLTNDSRGNFEFFERIVFIAPSVDQSTLFTLSTTGYLESYNFTNKALLSSIKLDFYKAINVHYSSSFKKIPL